MADQTSIDALRDVTVSPGRLFIGGDWRDAAGVMETISPLNGQALTTIGAGDAGDIDRAVVASLPAPPARSAITASCAINLTERSHQQRRARWA